MVIEAGAGRFNVDTVHPGSGELEALHREKLLQPVNSPHHKNLFAAALPAHREWAPTFARGFCQIVDWFAKLADQEKTDDFDKRFGARSIDYTGLLVVGRNRHLEAGEHRRLEWWRSRLLVDSHFVAPKASAASRCSRGTAMSASRDTEIMNGNVITARMMPNDVPPTA